MAKEPTNKSDKLESLPTPSDSGNQPKVWRTTKAILSSRIFFVILVVVLASVPSIYFYRHAQVKKIVGNLQTVDQVVEQVNKLYILPNGESPTMATVTDVNVAKSQPFLANAVNGDKVLIYPRARLAILYRPSVDKLVGVTHLTVNSAQQ